MCKQNLQNYKEKFMNSLMIQNLQILPILVGGKIVKVQVSFEITLDQKPELIPTFPEYADVKKISK